MQEVDIIYNLLTFLNSTQEGDMYGQIAETIIRNLERIPTISITELADLCYTSTATISRFCKRFNCLNFAQFKIEVKDGLEQAKTEIRLPIEDLNLIKEKPSHLIDRVYGLIMETLEMGIAGLDMNEIDQICHLIHTFDKIHFFGMQFNKVVASDIQLKFIKLGKFIYAYNERGDNSHKLDLLSEASLVIFLSVSSKDEYVASLAEMKERKATILMVTMQENPLLSSYVDYTLLINGKESTFSESSISGSIGMLAVLNVLYVRYGILFPKL